uniref:SFRICE_020499 n=1 Tax=Spodoptera frugiperda TaxID=7108 RepID=A0A2H1V6J7_SPOFR
MGIKGLSGIGNIGEGDNLASGNLTQRNTMQAFTSVFCEAVVSLRSSRPIRAETWLSHTLRRELERHKSGDAWSSRKYQCRPTADQGAYSNSTKNEVSSETSQIAYYNSIYCKLL